MMSPDNRYFRWAMVIARAEGALEGVVKAFAAHGSGSMPELEESVRELSVIRGELRHLAAVEAVELARGEA